MAAQTPYFVDPAINANGGTGIITDPWTRAWGVAGGVDVVQNGLNQIVAGPTRDAVDGDIIHVKSNQVPGVVPTSEDETTAVLNLAAYGAPALDAPLTIQGYHDAAGDGGIGGMNGMAGGWSLYDGNAGATDYVNFIDMHLHNTGVSAAAIYLRNYSTAIGCQIHGTWAGRTLRCNNYCLVANSYIYDNAVAEVLGLNAFCQAIGNYVTGAVTSCIRTGSTDNLVERNILIPTAVATLGLDISQARNQAIGNTILSTAAGTGSGIRFDAATHDSCSVVSNLIEGFSGVGGGGIDFGTTLRHINIYANNSFYDCGPLGLDDIINDGDKNYEADNEILTASPFLQLGAMTFANRFEWFKPIVTGNVRGGAFPTGSRFDRGAVQRRIAVERTIPATVVTTIPARVTHDPLE